MRVNDTEKVSSQIKERLFGESFELIDGKRIRRIYLNDLNGTKWNVGSYLVCYCDTCKVQRHHKFLFAVYRCSRCDELNK